MDGTYSESFLDPLFAQLEPQLLSLNDKYVKLLRDNAKECAPTLRNLYRSRLPYAINLELSALSTSLASVLKKASTVSSGIRLDDRWNDLISSGLSDVYQEIIGDEIFLKELGTAWTVGIIVGLTCLATLCNKIDDKKLTERLTTNPAMLRNLWIGRRHLCGPGSFLQQLEHADYFLTILSELVYQFAVLYFFLDPKMPAWSEVPLAQLSFFCWFHAPEPGPTDEPHGLLAFFLSVETYSFDYNEMQSLLEACHIADEYEPEKCLLRVQRALEVEGNIDTRLRSCFRMLTLLSRFPTIAKYIGPHKAFKYVAEAVSRQRAQGDQKYLWLITTHATYALVHSIDVLPLPQCVVPLLRDYDIIGILAGGVVAFAEIKDMSDTDGPGPIMEIIDKFSIIATSAAKRSGRNSLFHTLQHEVENNWYPTLKTLRSTPRPPGRARDYRELEESWKMLGKTVGLEENAERERYEREAKHQCAWKKCTYHKTKSPNQMLTCKGCGEARYCGRDCQLRDWKEGGHKARCKRLKDAE